MPSARRIVLAAVTLSLALSVSVVARLQEPAPPPIVGRWDLTVTGAGTSFPSWLEVQKSGNHTLVGRYVGSGGSSRPISKIEFADNVMRFAIPPQWEQGDGELRVEGKLEGDALSGTMVDPGGRQLTWTAKRAPALRRTTAPEWGAPITLVDGELTAWEAGQNSQWRVVDGVLMNQKSGANLVTRQRFNDFKAHVEFRYPKGSNSGVYLRGRYEVQIEDSTGTEPLAGVLAAVYGFLPPNQNAAKKAGEWQSFDITLVGRTVTVALNDRTVICEQEIPGVTGGALDSDEGAPGPLMLQGDHGPIDYRNIVVTPAK
jgi:Domain of Unknown Function (DUF1080)